MTAALKSHRFPTAKSGDRTVTKNHPIISCILAHDQMIISEAERGNPRYSPLSFPVSAYAAAFALAAAITFSETSFGAA